MNRIRPKKFAHIVYRTRRFEQILSWYTQVFGAKVQHQDPALAFLTYDDEHHRFAFANLSVLQPQGTQTEKEGLIGVDHVAYTFASLDQLLDNYVQLKELGIKPIGAFTTELRCRCTTRTPMEIKWSFRLSALSPTSKRTRSWLGQGLRRILSAWNLILTSS